MGLFAPDQHNGRSTELIPAGLLAWAKLDFEGFKFSTNSEGGRYANMKATVQLGKYAGRVIFFMIADVFDKRNSEGFREMAMVQLKHICEGFGIFQPQSPQSYSQFDNATFEIILQTIMAKPDPVTGIRVNVQKGKDGYEDKNGLDFLSPSPNSKSKANWDLLIKAGSAGEVIPVPKGLPSIPTAPAVFGGNPQQNAAAAVGAPQPGQQSGATAPGWLQQGQAAPQQVVPQAAPAPQAAPPVATSAPASPVPAAVTTAAQQGEAGRPF